METLKNRHTEVMELILQGATGKEMADTLGVEVQTTKNYVNEILKYYGCQSRMQLMAKFLKVARQQL